MPFRTLAAAWSGGVMLGQEASDEDYKALMEAVAAQADVGALIETRPLLRRMVETGKGGVPYDLMFPEVFYPEARAGGRVGFHAVVGNPPWDTVRPLAKEFFAAFDLQIMNAPTKRERESIEKALLTNVATQALWHAYSEEIEQAKQCFGRAYDHQREVIDGKMTGGDLDLGKLFAERTFYACCSNGAIGLVLPGSFYSASGTAALRKLYLDHANLRALLAFHNTHQLFETRRCARQR